MRKTAGNGLAKKKVPGLPRHRLHSTFGARLFCAGLAGCTTGNLGLDEPQLSLAAGVVDADDPVLPDSVEVMPSVYSLAEEQDAIAASAVPVAYSVSATPVAYSAPAPAGAAAVMAAVNPAGLPGGKVAARSPELDALIARYADHHEIPVELLRRVVSRESTFNPAARNGPYWGLMQILPQTARTMGYDGGPEGLLDAETNLKYAGRYLRGAYLVADGNHDLAVRYYSRGYYYDAKRKGLLEETGLGKDRRRMKRDG